MKQKLNTMLELQDAMNTRVNKDWVAADYPWYRAIWTECGEMLDHYGWKWWKHQKPDMEQVRLELVDIWHFLLSVRLMQEQAREHTLAGLAEDLANPVKDTGLRTTIEQMAMDAIQTKAGNARIFAGLMELADMSFADLYLNYVGKNVLNFFRQDHGYKEGHYRKTWHDREDNEHLMEIINRLDADSEDFSKAIYNELESVYSTI